MKWIRNRIKMIGTFIIKIFFPCKIHGKENIIKGQKCIIVGNHYRIFDFYPLMRLFKGKVFFLAKEEIFKKKGTARFVRNFGGIPVNREQLSMSTVMDCMKVLKEGYPLVIYPEGTRNKVNEDLQPIKGGAFMFATRTSSPVIPIMYAHKQKLFRKSHLIVGKPIDLSQYNGKKISQEDMEQITKIVYDEMVALREQLLEILDKKKGE